MVQQVCRNEQGLRHHDYTTSQKSGLCKQWDSVPELFRRLIEIKQIFGDWCCQSCWSICLIISLLLSLTWRTGLDSAPLSLTCSTGTFNITRLAAEKKDSVFCAMSPISMKCYKYTIQSKVVGHWDGLFVSNNKVICLSASVLRARHRVDKKLGQNFLKQMAEHHTTRL